MDMLSNLPEEIICHTLSFLSTKEAVKTCILSKRWRNLFAFTQNLCFEDKDFVYYNASFTCFLDRVLSISGNSPVKKFSLEYGYMVDSDHIYRWIFDVISRGTLNHLHIVMAHKDLTTLPLKFFTCKTLVTLRLGKGFILPLAPEGTFFPALKTIFLNGIRVHDQTVLEALLSACHVLEELQIFATQYEYISSCHTVSCTTLQRLTIVGVYWAAKASFCFDTPSLVYLKYSGSVPREYRVVNLDSLVEANIHFTTATSLLHSCDPTNLIKCLRNIKILKLASLDTSEIFCLLREAIPVLEKLSHLSIETGYKSWRLLQVFLNKSPNLESLVIEDFYLGCIGNIGICECVSSCPVKVLEIANFCGTVQEIAQIRHLLKKRLRCLKLLKVRAWTQPATDLSFFSFEKKPPTDLSIMTLQRITQNRKIRLEIISS